MVNKLVRNIEDESEKLIDISHSIHDTPELGFEEYQSSKRLCDYLSRLGFDVDHGVGRFDTAFVAHLKKELSNVPTVAIIAEYDALPGIGHGCGHNVISAVACGVAAAFSDLDFEGNLKIIGTPAEETGGGKIELLNLGVFDDVDYAMMVHPSSTNLVNRGGTALVEVDISFKGKRAHSSEPEGGINALKALINTFNGIDAIQNELPLGININGIITSGGEASNIIPEYASAEFIIRGLSLYDLKYVKEKIINVVRAAELVTGAVATCTFKPPYAERYSNRVLDDAFKGIFESYGETVNYPKGNIKLGSSDIGNVSLKLPIIHPYVKIGSNISAHTLAFSEAARSKEADQMILKASKVLAELTYKIFKDAGFRSQIDQAFLKTVPDYSKFVF